MMAEILTEDLTSLLRAGLREPWPEVPMGPSVDRKELS
jgi:hypothetical protein